MTFLKDRVIAEQFAKDSLEAMLQGDVDNMRSERGKLLWQLFTLPVTGADFFFNGINIALICCSQYMFCLNDMWLFSDKLKEELVKEQSAKEVVSFPDM